MSKIIGKHQTRQVFIDGWELLPDYSQTLVNHSPDGFNWGYGGSGPAQLALALLLYFTSNERISRCYYQDFKWEVVSRLPGDFEIDSKAVYDFLDTIEPAEYDDTVQSLAGWMSLNIDGINTVFKAE